MSTCIMSRLALQATTHMRLWFAMMRNVICNYAIERTKEPPLWQLPLEVILHILSFLPCESTIALSISCKPLYNRLFPLVKDGLCNADTKYKFLRLLERDLQPYILCGSWWKLYKWDTAQRCAWNRWLCPKHSRRTHPGATRLCTGHRFYRLEIQLRDLVLRAYEHGAGWGLPLSVLQQSCRERFQGAKRRL